MSRCLLLNIKNIINVTICVIVAGLASAYICEAVDQSIHQKRLQNVPTPPRSSKVLWPDASFYKWESKNIVGLFQNNGLEVNDIKPGFTLGAPLPREATIFLIPSFGENIGGYVSSYNIGDNLKNAKNYYHKMNKDTEFPAWWIFEKDNILVLISGKVPEEKARQYEKVLNEIDKK